MEYIITASEGLRNSFHENGFAFLSSVPQKRILHVVWPTESWVRTYSHMVFPLAPLYYSIPNTRNAGYNTCI